MLVNVVSLPDAQYRVLVLAAHNDRLTDLGQTGDESDLSAMISAGHLHIDALVGDVSEDEISQALLSGRYDVFHAALHGDPDGLALSKEFLERDQLGELLQVHGVTLAVLLSCLSADVAKRVASSGVSVVIGTTVEVTNSAAYAFCLKFYRHLVRNSEPVSAFEYARRLLRSTWRDWFVMFRAQDCTESLDQLSRIECRLEGIEQRIADCQKALSVTEQRILDTSSQGHQQITDATLGLVNLFQSLLGGRK